MDYAKAVREFVISNFLYGDNSALTDDTSFLESGIIDSTGMLELIGFVENTFQLRIRPEELVAENLDSVTRVANFLARKLVPA